MAMMLGFADSGETLYASYFFRQVSLLHLLSCRSSRLWIMEGIASVAGAKRQKIGKKQGRNMYGRRTRLENLPDAILLHILSFLPIETVVRTSLLAKRWQNFWKLVSHVNIEDGGANWMSDLDDSEETSAERVSFMNFAESMLLKRDSSNINDFTLSLSILRDAPRVNSWIFAALTHRIRKLHLKLRQILDKDFELPSCLFTSQFLTQLKIDMSLDLRLPPTIFLPGLEELELSHVAFSEDSSTVRLFSGCPNLMKLSLEECDWSKARAICISAPRLEELIITEYDCNSSRPPQVVVFAANLKNFSLTRDLSNDYFFYSLPLVHGCINFVTTDNRRDHRELAYRMHRLLWQLAGVQSLSISSDTLEVLEWAKDLLAHLPCFWRLDSLYVIESATTLPSAAMLALLQKSPRLSLLDFEWGLALLENYEGTPVINPVPSCFETHLKTIRINVYSQTVGELYILSQFLRAGSVLEKVYISSLELKNGPDAILKLYRRSQNCQIVISVASTEVVVRDVD